MTRPELLSDKELLQETKVLVRREQQTTLAILVLLGEVERRRLHAKLGYSSMFEYCTQHLRYSASAAGRRVQVARCLRRFPQAQQLFASGEINLSTLGILAPVLTEANAGSLFERIRNKSQREVDVIVCGARPAVIVRDRVKPIHVIVRANTGRQRADSPALQTSSQPAGQAASRPLEPTPATSDRSRSGSAKTPNSDPAAEIQQKMLIQFAASPEFMKKLDRARALLAHRAGGFEQVFELALDFLLDQRDPARRSARRAKRREKKPEPTPANTGNARRAKQREKNPKPAPADAGTAERAKQGGEKLRPTRASTGTTALQRGEKSKPTPANTGRHVAAGVRDTIFERDGGRCTYVGKSGRRCTARHYLQIDHVKPVVRGGTSHIDNLRLLCGPHNRIEAERVLGEWCGTRHKSGAPD